MAPAFSWNHNRAETKIKFKMAKHAPAMLAEKPTSSAYVSAQIVQHYSPVVNGG